MEQVFDGTEKCGGQRYEPHVAVHVNTPAYDCLAEVRNMREAELNRKVRAMLAREGRCGPDDNYHEEWCDLEREKQIARTMQGVPRNDPEYDYLHELAKKGQFVGSK